MMQSGQGCEGCSPALLAKAKGPSYAAEKPLNKIRRIQAAGGSWDGKDNPIAGRIESVYTE